MFIQEELDRYCYWQVERENIRLQKEISKLPSPWTDDPILREFKFCQVFREDDKLLGGLEHIYESLCIILPMCLWLLLFFVGLILFQQAEH